MLKEKVLFICTNNSARSQMAEGYLKHAYGENYEVYSAGMEPKTINTYAIKVMEEIGVDISNYRSKSLEEFAGQEFNHIITVCSGANQACPFFPGGKKYTHKGFIDPAEVKGDEYEIIKAFKEVRDQIISWIDTEFKNNK